MKTATVSTLCPCLEMERPWASETAATTSLSTLPIPAGYVSVWKKKTKAVHKSLNGNQAIVKARTMPGSMFIWMVTTYLACLVSSAMGEAVLGYSPAPLMTGGNEIVGLWADEGSDFVVALSGGTALIVLTVKRKDVRVASVFDIYFYIAS